MFRIYLEQLIIRNACERYYPKKAILENEKFEYWIVDASLIKSTILDKLELAKEMTLYL